MPPRTPGGPGQSPYFQGMLKLAPIIISLILGIVAASLIMD